MYVHGVWCIWCYDVLVVCLVHVGQGGLSALVQCMCGSGALYVVHFRRRVLQSFLVLFVQAVVWVY